MRRALPLNVVILAGGESRRMLSHQSKVLHFLGGRPVLSYVLECGLALSPEKLIVVASLALKQNPFFTALIPKGILVETQNPPKGTGDAVRTILSHLSADAHVIVLFGDTPLLSQSTLSQFQAHHFTCQADVSIMGIRPPCPTGYGRLILSSDAQTVVRIVEEKDATPEERAIPLCNGGVMLFSPRALQLVENLTPTNHAGEYYLTDLIALSAEQGFEVTFFEASYEEVLGINTRADLATAESFLQQKWRAAALEKGVTLIDPSSTYFSFDTQIEEDVTLYPHVFLGPNVILEKNTTVFPFSVLTHTHAKEGTSLGPFCHTRAHTVLEKKAVVGNFVEVKKSVLGEKATAKHLTYLGDAHIGAGANIGAGTITCNYDGTHKHNTHIGIGAFVGSNTSLIAPVSIGDGAKIGAGSVITQDVPAYTLGLTRPSQHNRPLKPKG